MGGRRIGFVSGDNGSRESGDDTSLILPRQGEVAPQVTDGEEHETCVVAPSPSAWQEPATSPERGRIAAPLPWSGPEHRKQRLLESRGVLDLRRVTQPLEHH